MFGNACKLKSEWSNHKIHDSNWIEYFCLILIIQLKFLIFLDFEKFKGLYFFIINYTIKAVFEPKPCLL